MGVLQPCTSNWLNPNQMQYSLFSTPYQVYGDSFLPQTLIQDASIVAQDVYPSKCFCGFLKGSLREGRQLGNIISCGIIHRRAVTICQLILIS